MKRRLNRDTLAALERSGYRVSSLYQRPADDGRKLKVAQPGDPWTAHVFQPDPGKPVAWHARKVAYADGPTPDAAVLAAIPSSGGLMSSYRVLSDAIDSLILTMRRRTA